MTDSHKMAIVDAPSVPIAALSRQHPLVEAAMRSGTALADPTTLRELLALQREYEAGEARKSFTRALADLKRDLPTVIAKDAVVDFTSDSGKRTYYKHASLAGVMDAITEPLTRHGFSLNWTPATSDRSVRVTCRLTHAAGHAEECSLDAPRDDSGRKSHAQAVASTITLLSRYTALALLGIATADMEEDTGEARAKAPAPDAVDVPRNMRAMKWLADRGVAREAAEARVGRPVGSWTAADLDALRAWARPPEASTGEVPAAQEPPRST